MSRFRAISAVLLSCVAASVSFMAPAAEQTDTIAIAPNVYVRCQYRIAAIFPSPPMMRDITYTNGDLKVPARQFYVERGMDLFSVTVADFTNGPAIDDTIVENAVVPLRQRGEVRFQHPEDYTPGIPGRQLNIFEANGRQHRASVYMADHRLVITEANAAPGDFNALQFEQSILMLDANGRDLNNVANRQRYACEK